ncbi:MAG: SRPBCC family protein [Solirubrobacterales bacterium]
MPDYEFLTTWCLEAPRERVWDAIWDAERWPEWWRGVVAARTVAAGDRSGVGQVGRYTWRSRLPYDLEFEMVTTTVDKPRLLEGEARGELAGIGRWRLFEEDGEMPVTAVVYEWSVSTTKPWMNLLAPLARPVFEWNHDWVMGNGGAGLAALLGCRLLASD